MGLRGKEDDESRTKGIQQMMEEKEWRGLMKKKGRGFKE
jgi:hypothetical protein